MFTLSIAWEFSWGLLVSPLPACIVWPYHRSRTLANGWPLKSVLRDTKADVSPSVKSFWSYRMWFIFSFLSRGWCGRFPVLLVDGISMLPIPGDEGGRERGREGKKKGGREAQPFANLWKSPEWEKAERFCTIKNRKNTLKFPMYYTREMAWMCLGERQWKIPLIMGICALNSVLKSTHEQVTHNVSVPNLNAVVSHWYVEDDHRWVFTL